MHTTLCTRARTLGATSSKILASCWSHNRLTSLLALFAPARILAAPVAVPGSTLIAPSTVIHFCSLSALPRAECLKVLVPPSKKIPADAGFNVCRSEIFSDCFPSAINGEMASLVFRRLQSCKPSLLRVSSRKNRGPSRVGTAKIRALTLNISGLVAEQVQSIAARGFAASNNADINVPVHYAGGKFHAKFPLVSKPGLADISLNRSRLAWICSCLLRCKESNEAMTMTMGIYCALVCAVFVCCGAARCRS